MDKKISALKQTMRVLRTVLVAIFIVMLGYGRSANAAASLDDGVLRSTLDNGLHVVIVRNALAPVVATSVDYLVGSDEAPEGYPGMAHAQEHMMFRGSPGLSADQLANISSFMGGRFNANTRESDTQYLYTVPSNNLDLVLNIEALRMRDVLDTPEDWEKERGALEQEVDEDLSSPAYVTYAKLRSMIFTDTPYEHDALGTRSSFNKTTAAMLKDFHDRWYAPNNAVLVIVGNIDPPATLEKVKNLFGSIPRKSIPRRPTIHPRPLNPQSLSVPTDDPYATQIIAMRIPGQNSADFPALELLEDILESQRFSLYGLVADGKALSADFQLDPLPEAGLCYVTVSFTGDKSPTTIDDSVREILRNVAKNGVPRELFEAAKNLERRETAFFKNSISDQAALWSDAISLYGLSSPEEDLNRIEKVSLADVNRVAREYLDLNHAVSATMRPQPSENPIVASGGFGGQETISLSEANPADFPNWAQPALNDLTPPISAVSPELFELPNGLTLIVQPEDVSNTVTLYGHIRTRTDTDEPSGKEGASLILDKLLSHGTKARDRISFQKALDDVGASERAGTDFGVKVLARNFDRAVELLAENEITPALPDQLIRRLKVQMARTVSARNRTPDYLSQRALLSSLRFKSASGALEATEQTIMRLTPRDIKMYYQKFYRPDLTTIVIVGAISTEHARAVVEKYFGRWTVRGPKIVDNDNAPLRENEADVISIPDSLRVQTNVVLAQNLALTRADSDYYPLLLGNAVLGGSFYSSRLTVDLRKNLGLVYSVNSDLEISRSHGIFSVQFSTDPENVNKISGIISDELKTMQDKPIGTAELKRAKAFLIQQIPLDDSNVDDIAQDLATRYEMKLPLDEPELAAKRYIELRSDEVENAFLKWIRPDGLVRVDKGPTQ